MKWIGFVIAIVVAAVAAFMVLKFSGNNDAQTQPVQVGERAAPQVEAVNVYVAANFIPIGTVLEENMLTVQPWPKHLLVDGFIVGQEQGQSIIGTVTRAPFQALEPIMRNKIVNPDDPNFLAGDLPKGMRVVTMRTDEISGVAGFIFPGDRVDVLINHEILREDVSASDIHTKDDKELYEDVAETLLTNARVLAVDQRATGGVTEEGGIIIPKSVSLEVSPADAQRVVLAREMGRLSLALRSIKDKDTTETVAITRQPDLSQANEVVGSNRGPVKVVRGVQIEVLETDEEEKQEEDGQTDDQ
jgi:pilus assembly protein CpaB